MAPQNNQTQTTSYHQNVQKARASRTTQNPIITKYTSPIDRQAATLGMIQKIMNHPAYKGLPPEAQDALRAKYYDKVVKPVYENSHLAAPDKELWVRAVPHTPFRPSDYYVGINARQAGAITTGTVKEVGNIANGIFAAGAWVDRKLLGLQAFFPNDAVRANAVRNLAEFDKREKADPFRKVSQDTIDSADFWLQTNPSRKFMEKVDSFVGEQIIQLPLYEALGAARIAGAAKLSDMSPAVGNFTKRLMSSKLGVSVARRLGEASDAFIGGTLEGQSENEKWASVASYMGRGALLDTLGGSLRIAGGAAIKRWTANNLAVGGKVFQETVTNEATHELEHGIEEHAADPVKHKLVTAEKMTLTSLGVAKFGKKWNQLSQSQRTEIHSLRDKLTNDASEELPIHVPEVAKHETESQLANDVKTNPSLAADIDQFQKNYPGISVSDAVVGAEKRQLELQTGVKNAQSAQTKFGKSSAAANEATQKATNQRLIQEPKRFASFKEATLYYLKHPPSVSGGSGAPKFRMDKWLEGMDSKDFLKELQDQIGSKELFENPEHLLLWANHFRDKIPKALARRVQDELRERDPHGSPARWAHQADNLERHMDKLATTGHLFSEGNIFKSTQVEQWINKTQWQHELAEETDEAELENLVRSIKPYKNHYPELHNQALATLVKLQALRKVARSAEQDRKVTEKIRKIPSQLEDNIGHRAHGWEN